MDSLHDYTRLASHAHVDSFMGVSVSGGGRVDYARPRLYEC